jgi:hypothetical protein
VDIYRLIYICAVLAFTWCMQTIGFSKFRQAVQDGPPKVNVVDFEKDFVPHSPADADRSLGEMAKEKGWDLTRPFVPAWRAEELREEYTRNKWLALAAGFAGMLGTLFTAWRLWEDWWKAAVAVVLGPLAVAWFGYAGSR